jgi:glutathione synthase/RimK-type ligase-like ATP-grasp enzyme
VFLAHSEREWAEFALRSDAERFIVQPLCDEAGKDLRVYVLGGEILAGVYRVSSSDFRSNYSLGGSVQRIPAPVEMVKMVGILHQGLGLDFVGVDFIRHGGKWVFNELEDSVGCRMLYQTSEIDAVCEYTKYVANVMKNKQERE